MSREYRSPSPIPAQKTASERRTDPPAPQADRDFAEEAASGNSAGNSAGYQGPPLARRDALLHELAGLLGVPELHRERFAAELERLAVRLAEDDGPRAPSRPIGCTCRYEPGFIVGGHIRHQHPGCTVHAERRGWRGFREAGLDPTTLTARQRDGLACVVCASTVGAMVPASRLNGVQTFVHEECC